MTWLSAEATPPARPYRHFSAECKSNRVGILTTIWQAKSDQVLWQAVTGQADEGIRQRSLGSSQPALPRQTLNAGQLVVSELVPRARRKLPTAIAYPPTVTGDA